MVAAWLRFLRYLRMTTKQNRSIMNPTIGSTTARVMIRLVWTRPSDVELPAEVPAEGAVGTTVLPR